MRGKAAELVRLVSDSGITPAYAGKSYATALPVDFVQDHPRLCGEKVSGMRRSCKNSGSPPPMRGKVLVRVSPHASAGITPAYAGKSGTAFAQIAFLWDHPRLCGEKVSTLCCTSAISGSPPPMRGKVAESRREETPHRITPAYAGKRVSEPCRRMSPEDHPRLCGEKSVICLCHFCKIGSPPPMRGKAKKVYPKDSEIRITPAYAGKRRSFEF